ncbi:DNA-binding protein WhiA [Caldisericum sp. AR60]|uniref:DNA-binding protein WhiA n=1 Tax=Caldisericum sp. AR60 TaxID=3397852 RepID=UPI0039FD3B49
MNIRLKRELSSVNEEPLFELYGIAVGNGHIVISNEKMLKFSSRELFVIRKIISLFNDLNIRREKDIISTERGIYEIIFSNVIEEFEIDKIFESVKHAKSNEKKAFLRGVYIGCGIISTPPSYHLEFRFEKDTERDFVSIILSQFKVKHSVKPGRIFIKGRENIKDFLYVVKAFHIYTELEEDAVEKSVINEANRLANFEYANLKRQTNSASKEIKAIKSLIEKGKFDSLDPDLKEVAILRLEYPFMSLRELSEKTKGRFSKQEIYYRLKKIESYGE